MTGTDMDLIDRLNELAIKIPKLREQGLLQTEEATKNALVMPFINALGYNVFDPLEVTPELHADVGLKKGEKVDYAILKDGHPVMLFECKTLGTNLKDVHASQLYRYFSVTKARFAVLTDGVSYRFYTDLDAPNIMDQAPFFIFDLADVKESTIKALKQFTKSAFNEAEVLAVASELKYRNAIREYLNSMIEAPSEGFVRLCLQESEAYRGRFTQAIIQELSPIVRDALRAFVTDQVDRRLKSALDASPVDTKVIEPEIAEEEPENSDRGVDTTQDEMDAYYIIKAIVREILDPSRVTMRDAKSYCAILIDDNNRKPLCRLRFTSTQMTLALIGEDRNEERIVLGGLDDLYQYTDQLKLTASRYVEK